MKPQTADMLGDPLRPKLGIGYAGSPGKGPDGETCGTCIHSQRHGSSTRYYYKCHHELAYRSSSVASDIKLHTFACEHWFNDDSSR
jgi:hypothetical protein